jgi:hypothetical protein
MGFGYVEDNGPEEINPRYFKNRKDGLRVGSLSHVMNAQVCEAMQAAEQFKGHSHFEK